MGGAVSLSVGYPGPRGSHSDAAAVVLAPGARTVDLPSFSAVVEAAGEARVDLGVLPIESSLIGPIAETHDLLYEAPLSIVREATLPIRHCVVGLAGASFDRARTVRSHQAAFDQCRDLLRASEVQLIGAATTADAAREVAERGDPAAGRDRAAPRPQLTMGSRCCSTTSAMPGCVHTVRRARAVHAGRGRRGVAYRARRS